jgi:nitrogen fixation protein NifU and related proteins
MSLSMDSMYQQIIIDHYKHPQHRGEISPFDAQVHHVNPTCGDEVTLRIRLADGQIAELGWVGEGCSISQAATSVMSDLVIGNSVEDALRLQEKFLELMQSQGQSTLTEDEAEALEDAVAFEGVSKYPARVKCALLGWMAMKSAVAEAIGDAAQATGDASVPDDRDEEKSVEL